MPDFKPTFGLQSSSGEKSPPKFSVLKEFTAIAVGYGLIALFTTCILSAATLIAYGDLAHLSLTMGNTNPISLGALLTGFVALAGFSFLITQDKGELFGLSEGADLQRLITLLLMLAGAINILWEFLRTALNLYARRVQHLEELYGGKASPQTHNLPGHWGVSLTHDLTGNRLTATVFSLRDLGQIFYSPNLIALGLLTSASIAFSLTLGRATNPLPRAVISTLHYLDEKIVDYKNITQSLQASFLRDVVGNQLTLGKRFKNILYIFGEYALIIGLWFSLNRLGFINVETAIVAGFACAGTWALCTFAFVRNKIHMISYGRFVDWTSVCYWSGVALIMVLATIRIVASYSQAATILACVVFSAAIAIHLAQLCYLRKFTHNPDFREIHLSEEPPMPPTDPKEKHESDSERYCEQCGARIGKISLLTRISGWLLRHCVTTNVAVDLTLLHLDKTLKTLESDVEKALRDTATLTPHLNCASTKDLGGGSATDLESTSTVTPEARNGERDDRN